MKKSVKVQKQTKPLKKSNIEEPIKKILFWLTPGLFILFTLYMTMVQNPDLLWKLQDLDLFAFNDQFFMEKMQKVGGMSMFLSSFLNQFFFLPWAGALLFTCILLLVGILTAKAFNLKGWQSPLAFIPPLALLLCMTELGYMVYFIKVDGYVYNNIIGVLFLLSGLIAFKKINNRLYKTLFSFAFLLFGYPACGVFALFGLLLMILNSIKKLASTKQRDILVPILAMAAFLVFIPLLYYHFVFEQIALSDIYLANLPYFTLKGSELKFWFPFSIIAVLFVAQLWLKPIDTGIKQSLWLKILPFALFLIMMALTYVFSYKETNFNTELSMLRAADSEEWHDILRTAGKQKEEPSRLIVMTTNLALNKLGLAGENMYHYKNGDKEIKSPRFIVPIHIAGPVFYYQYGIPTYCTKWCMEGLVEYGLSNSVLRYAVLSALLNGDIPLAKKYNDVLLTTLFQKSWAKKHQRYIDHPETIAEADEFKSIIPLTNFDDVLNEDYYNLESFLRIHFSSMKEVPGELTELSVLFNMDIKDDKRFWPRLFRWVKLHPNAKIPVHFQEAALLFADLTKMDISGAPFDANVTAAFKNFLGMVQQYGNYPEATMKQLFYPQYGKTYWYYYFFVKGPQSNSEVDKGYSK